MTVHCAGDPKHLAEDALVPKLFERSASSRWTATINTSPQTAPARGPSSFIGRPHHEVKKLNSLLIKKKQGTYCRSFHVPYQTKNMTIQARINQPARGRQGIPNKANALSCIPRSNFSSLANLNNIKLCVLRCFCRFPSKLHDAFTSDN